MMTSAKEHTTTTPIDSTQQQRQLVTRDGNINIDGVHWVVLLLLKKMKQFLCFTVACLSREEGKEIK